MLYNYVDKLPGTRESHSGETEPKVILVNAGGTLEIHGQPTVSWSKLSGTLLPSRKRDIIFEHAVGTFFLLNL